MRYTSDDGQSVDTERLEPTPLGDVRDTFTLTAQYASVSGIAPQRSSALAFRGRPQRDRDISYLWTLTTLQKAQIS
ncbi:hypothetical protein NUW54_g3997 [Trametes sanguinea]|uniref:Uncharacterized protein n=1 Tax=Trametes sanguinea TaxID=158606 RepID=A0ACC1PZR6_9APHY|nr:hypothetical protein NUW54_g3997 [Trametes sanguinea]